MDEKNKEEETKWEAKHEEATGDCSNANDKVQDEDKKVTLLKARNIRLQ